MSDSIAERLTELEAAVGRAAAAVARLREENDRLRRDNRRLEDERKQMLTQIDAVLRDIAKLDLGTSWPMSDAARVDLTLLGQTLTLRSEADPTYLRSLAASVEERVAALQKSGVRDVFKALVLVALEMSDELHRARDERTK